MILRTLNMTEGGAADEFAVDETGWPWFRLKLAQTWHRYEADGYDLHGLKPVEREVARLELATELAGARELVDLSLAPGSLERLLAGELVLRVWLTPDTDDVPGTYRLECRAAAVGFTEAALRCMLAFGADDPEGEAAALERLGLDPATSEPPLPEPDEHVAVCMDAIRAAMAGDR